VADPVKFWDMLRQADWEGYPILWTTMDDASRSMPRSQALNLVNGLGGSSH
jgi:hypothetical protein